MTTFKPLTELRRFREEQGLTQQDIADMLDVTCATISRWESGDRRPDRAYIRDLVTLTEIDVMTLLGINPT